MLDWIRSFLRLIIASFQVFLMRDRKQIIKPEHDYHSASPTLNPQVIVLSSAPSSNQRVVPA